MVVEGVGPSEGFVFVPDLPKLHLRTVLGHSLSGGDANDEGRERCGVFDGRSAETGSMRTSIDCVVCDPVGITIRARLVLSVYYRQTAQGPPTYGGWSCGVPARSAQCRAGSRRSLKGLGRAPHPRMSQASTHNASTGRSIWLWGGASSANAVSHALYLSGRGSPEAAGRFVAVQMRNGSGRRLVWITILGIN